MPGPVMGQPREGFGMHRTGKSRPRIEKPWLSRAEECYGIGIVGLCAGMRWQGHAEDLRCGVLLRLQGLRPVRPGIGVG